MSTKIYIGKIYKKPEIARIIAKRDCDAMKYDIVSENDLALWCKIIYRYHVYLIM